MARYGPLTLADLPTPVRALPELAATWELGALHVKDDALTSSVYGGTKIRALEWLLGSARSEGRKSVVTVGPWGSHHAVATATCAQQAGLDCRLVLFPQPDGPEVAWARARLPSLASCTWCSWLGFPLRLLAADEALGKPLVLGVGRHHLPAEEAGCVIEEDDVEPMARSHCVDRGLHLRV